MLPSEIVLFVGRLKLIVADPPESESEFAWLMQYRRSPLVPLPVPVSVVAVTVKDVCAAAVDARMATHPQANRRDV